MLILGMLIVDKAIVVKILKVVIVDKAIVESRFIKNDTRVFFNMLGFAQKSVPYSPGNSAYLASIVVASTA